MAWIFKHKEEYTWKGLFGNPCELSSPIGDIVDAVMPEATKQCYCCSFLRGLVYGWSTAVIIAVLYVLGRYVC